MTDEKTALMLLKVGAWLQIPFSLLLFVIGGWLLWLLLPIIFDPVMWAFFGWFTLIILGFLIFAGIIGLLFTILWLRWRHDVPAHKNRLLTTSIVGMIIAGSVPGLLVLVGTVTYST